MNSHYDQAIEFILSNRPESVDAYLKSRKKYMSDDEYMLYAYKFYHFYPNSKLPTYRLFTFLKGIKHLEMAYIVIKRGLEKFPDDKTIWKYYISICHIFENVETQLDAAQKFTHKFPNDINAIISYAKILFTNERKDEAINLLVTTQKTDKYTYDVALNRTLADFYSKIFSYDKAIDILQQTFKKTEHVSVGIDLLHWYIEFKYYDKILQLLDVLIYKNGFLKSERVFPKLAKLLCTFKDSDNSLLDKFLYSFKNSDNTLSLLSKRVVHIISSQSKDIDVTNNFTLPLAGYLMKNKTNISNMIKIIDKYKELNYFNIIRFPFEKIKININDINIQSLAYILMRKNNDTIERLNDIFKKNIITILSDEKKIYYALLFSVIVNNLELKNTLIDYVSKNSHSYSPFITSLINNWKNSTRHLSECSTSYPSNTQQKSPLKVAVCVAGQLRGWEEALPSWFDYFHLSEYQTDFYVSTWKNIGTSTPKLWQKSRNFPNNLAKVIKEHYTSWGQFITDFPHITSIFNKINNINIKTLQDKYNTTNIIIEDDSIYPFNTFTNLQKMFYKWNSCINMVNQQYDIIIKTRPDVKFFAPYPSKEFIDNMFYDCIKNDSLYTDEPLTHIGYSIGCGETFHIGRHKTIENFSRLYSHIYSKNDLGKNILFSPTTLFRTHYTIGAYLFQNGIILKRPKIQHFWFVDPYIFSASELLILLEKDISMRKMTDSDKEIIAACKADIAEEKASTALEK